MDCEDDKIIPFPGNLPSVVNGVKSPNSFGIHSPGVVELNKIDDKAVFIDLSRGQGDCESGNEMHRAVNESTFNRSPRSSRISYLHKRCNRLKHKIRKLQMCQIGIQVDTHSYFEKMELAKSSCLILKKMKSIPEDSDETDSDSSSCDEDIDVYDCALSIEAEDQNLHKPKRKEVDKIGIKKTHISDTFAERNASTYNKWQWLQFQIRSLEIKILQTNETLRKVRSQEFKSKFEAIPFALSADGTTEETTSAARIRGLESHPRKKLVSTLNIITQSKNELPLSGVPCSCPPNLCCIICGGPGVLHLENPNPLSDFCYRRAEIVHPSYHKVICGGKIPLSVQYGRLIKGRKWTSRGSLSNSKREVASAKIGTVSSESLLQTKKARQTQLQKLLEVKKKTRSKKTKKISRKDERAPKPTQHADLNRPLADVNDARNQTEGNSSDSKRTR